MRGDRRPQALADAIWSFAMILKNPPRDKSKKIVTYLGREPFNSIEKSVLQNHVRYLRALPTLPQSMLPITCHPFSDMKKLNADGARIIQRGEGVHIWDNLRARSTWMASPGSGASMSAMAAWKSPMPSARQMNELPYYNTFFGTTTMPTTLLAEKVDVARPVRRFNHVFFTGSGSEANDTWFRMARVYWSAVGKPSKKIR